MENVLIISAHPDDETIGMGGTIFKHIQKGDVLTWLIITKTTTPEWSISYAKKKKEEVRKVAQVFKFKKIISAGFPATKLNAVPCGMLVRKIRDAIGKVTPQIVYCPPPDIHQDHDVVFRATISATRSLPGCPVKRVIAYEISTTTRFASPASGNFFIPNYYVDITSEFSQKIDTLKLYKSEIKDMPHPRSQKGMEILNSERGLSIGVDKAEAFVIIKDIWRN